MDWIKVEDGLPKLHYISDTWEMSDAVLALIADKYPTIARLNYNHEFGPPEWLKDGYGVITQWTYINLPKEENETKI